MKRMKRLLTFALSALMILTPISSAFGQQQTNNAQQAESGIQYEVMGWPAETKYWDGYTGPKLRLPGNYTDHSTDPDYKAKFNGLRLKRDIMIGTLREKGYKIHENMPLESSAKVWLFTTTGFRFVTVNPSNDGKSNFDYIETADGSWVPLFMTWCGNPAPIMVNETYVAVRQKQPGQVAQQGEREIVINLTVNNYNTNNINLPPREYIVKEQQEEAPAKKKGWCGGWCKAGFIALAVGGGIYAAKKLGGGGDKVFILQGGNATAIATGGDAKSSSRSDASVNANEGAGHPGTPPPSRTIPTKGTNGGPGGVIRNDSGRTITSSGNTHPFGQVPQRVESHHDTRPTKTLRY